jgi:hypothetical protein
MDRSKQFPPLERRGFNELFVGTKYLDAGYDALFACLKGECAKCFQKARELLGGHEAEQFIENERGGRPPDLLVFDKQTGRIRFVECKRKWEPFTPSQVSKFTEIENYLNHISTVRVELLSDSRDEKLFPALSPDQWIHIARVVPEQLVEPIPVAKEGYVVIGRLSINREKLAAELKAYEGTLESRDKLSW